MFIYLRDFLICEVVKGVEDRAETIYPFSCKQKNHKTVLTNVERGREMRLASFSLIKHADKMPNILFALAQASPDLVHFFFYVLYLSLDWSFVAVPLGAPMG